VAAVGLPEDRAQVADDHASTFATTKGVIVVSQHGQVFELKETDADGKRLWALPLSKRWPRIASRAERWIHERKGGKRGAHASTRAGDQMRQRSSVILATCTRALSPESRQQAEIAPPPLSMHTREAIAPRYG
jgi:hypothetical protein